MTMQIAIQASDGFVLASDIKNRLAGTPSSFMYHSKISLDTKHGIAISVMGYSANPEADPAGNLIAYLHDCPSPGQDQILAWADEYMRAGLEKYEEDNLSLLIIHPAAEIDRMWKFNIKGGTVSPLPSFRWLVLNGNEHNAAIVWPEYFKCEGKHTLTEATNIAALTILMGADVNPYGVRGLEIFKYTSQWKSMSESEIESITAKYDELKVYLQRFIS